MTDKPSIRRGGPPDFDAAVEVWRAANEARREERPLPAEHGGRMRRHMEAPGAFLFVADEGHLSGMAVGMPGLAEDGAGPPVDGLCHVGAVFVAPDRWGRGFGGELVDAVLAEARARGYTRAQLWTHAGNVRAHRLYTGRGFKRTGRENTDDLGETIVRYERDL